MSSLKRIFFIGSLLIITLILTFPASAQGPAQNNAGRPEAVPGEILVKFKPHVGRLGAQRSLDAEGIQTLEVSPHSGLMRAQVPPGQEEAFIARLEARGDVEYTTLNYYVHIMGDPNDPSYSSQWGLNNSGQTGGTPDADIDAPEAWDIHTGSDNITIAIIDTGIDLDHPDLQPKIVAGYDFVNGDNIADDDNGHGTHVAGIAAASGNNGLGIAGVSWGAKLMPVKVLNSSGNGSIFNVAAGIDFAVNNGARVINMSLGAPGTSYPCTGFQSIRDAMQRALDADRLVVVASGNENASAVSCPAAYDQAMAVGSTTSTDTRSSFSNYGERLDIAAPGSSIYSTLPGGSYDHLSGTSMATPHVAGLVALIWSLDTSLTNDQTRDIIQASADDLGAAGWDQYFGHGRINAWRALDLIPPHTSPEQLTFLIDDISSPANQNVQISTASPNVITWTTTISPGVSWLSVEPPDSGSISASSSPVDVTLTATRPVTYGVYTTTVIVTGTTSSGAVVGPDTSQVEINYVAELTRFYFPLIFKN